MAFCSDVSCKVASTPPGMQAASLDIENAYHNSPILPIHKPYLAVSWNDSIYVGHVMVEGLAMAGGIQGCLADALLHILDTMESSMSSSGVMIFQTPSHSILSLKSAVLYDFDLLLVFVTSCNTHKPSLIHFQPIPDSRKCFHHLCNF